MKISEVAHKTGLSVSTIRYYETTGLCPSISRGSDRQRAFSARDVEWLRLLASLRATGMRLSDMRRFATLYAAGDNTIPQRKAALLAHRQTLHERQAELDRCHELLDYKLARYDEHLRARA